jgi:hypothetical protein
MQYEMISAVTGIPALPDLAGPILKLAMPLILVPQPTLLAFK